MGKRLLLLAVYVEAADALAGEYVAKLGMHRVLTHRHEVPGGTTEAVALAGAELAPYLAVFSGKGPASTATQVLSMYPFGLNRMVYVTDDYERDVAWLAARGQVGESHITLGERTIRHVTAAVPELGVILDVIDAAEASMPDLLPPVIDALVRAPILARASVAATQIMPDACAPRNIPAGSALAAAELDHVAIYVADMAAADRVIRELLGQQHESDLSIPLKRGLMHARTFREGSVGVRTRFVITLVHSERGRVPDWIASHGGPGVHHLAHRVDDLDGALQLARDAGATQLSAVAEVEWLRQVMLRVTNDGYLHELIWRTDDRALDEVNALRLIESQ